jgi:uncharacterized NAD-dependent epimerase/dehydratase family protein
MNLRSKYDPPTPVIVLAEGAFGSPNGKTANGVVAHSELFDARAVVDSAQAGRTAAEVLSGTVVSDVPIFDSMAAALETAPAAETLVLGVAPAGGHLPDPWKNGIREAMAAGCDVISGLHTFLSEDPEWVTLADEYGVELRDVRKPPPESELRVADGRTNDVDAHVVLVMGTDCAVGKRTTAFELYRAATEAGMDAAWAATGQTGIMVGAHRGVAVDRVPSDFTAGVVEGMVRDLRDREIVFVEGQAALTHRVYGGVTHSILGGSWPDTVVITDDPDRERREHFESLPVPPVRKEAAIVEAISDAEVAAISTWGDPDVVEYDSDLPVANVFQEGGPAQLLDMVLAGHRGGDAT